MRRIVPRVVLAVTLAAGLVQGASGSVLTTASAASADACAGTGPEPGFWPFPVGSTSTWGLQIDGFVSCASSGGTQVPFVLQLNCSFAIQGQCAGPVSVAFSYGSNSMCVGSAVQSGLNFSGTCGGAGFDFDYAPRNWSLTYGG